MLAGAPARSLSTKRTRFLCSSDERFSAWGCGGCWCGCGCGCGRANCGCPCCCCSSSSSQENGENSESPGEIRSGLGLPPCLWGVSSAVRSVPGAAPSPIFDAGVGVRKPGCCCCKCAFPSLPPIRWPLGVRFLLVPIPTAGEAAAAAGSASPPPLAAGLGSLGGVPARAGGAASSIIACRFYNARRPQKDLRGGGEGRRITAATVRVNPHKDARLGGTVSSECDTRI